jgi:predicted ATP-dependent serine protease
MAKAQRRYVCQVCGSVSTKWQGQCVDCGEWNTMVEESGGGVVTPFAAKHDLRSGGRPIALSGWMPMSRCRHASSPALPSSIARSGADWWPARRR